MSAVGNGITWAVLLYKCIQICDIRLLR
jgi:hypothetical protein